MTGPTDTYAAILGATAPIDWKALEPHFAAGQTLTVSAELDLVMVAEALIADRAEQVKGYEITWEPKVLRHFTSKLRPVD